MLILLFGIEKAFTGALILLLTPLYHFGAFVFKIFLILSTGNLLETEAYKLMLENFYIVLGIVLLFFLAFTLLKTMVNPDDTTKTATTAKKVVINLVTSGIIMALLPTIFSFLFDFQHAFLVRQNTIGRFFGYGSTTSAENYEPDSSSVRTIEVASYTLANGVWTAFFNVDPEHEDCIEVYDETLSEKEKLATCQDTIESDDKRAFTGGAVLVRNDGTVENASGKHSFTTTMKYVENTGSFGAYKIFAQEVVDDKVSMNFLLAVVAGILLIYVGVSYSIDMAVRLVKLIFYQLIAPIPVFARVIPEGKMSSMFNEWLKITFTCYFEVFIRIFIFYFCIYLCNAMLETDFISGANPNPDVINIWQYGFWTALFTQAMIIIGLILFMKQAPGLISKLFGIDSSNMKLGIREKLANSGVFTAGAIAGGALTAGVRNVSNKYAAGREKGHGRLRSALGAARSGIAGTVSGGVRAGFAGKSAKSFGDMKGAASKGATGAIDARNRRANYRAAHGGFVGSVKGHIKDFGGSVKNYIVDESIEGLTRESNSMGKLASRYSAFSDGIEQILEKEQLKGGGSVFLGNGFALTNYAAFDTAAQNLATARAQFNNGSISAVQLRAVEGAYISARDAVRDELIDISLEGSKGASYTALTAKGQAALKDSLVNAEALQATILENANTKVVQDIMGSSGNNALKDIMDGTPLKSTSFSHNGTKLKDAAKVAQGQADIKIAEMNKENAAKGDKK